MYPKIVTANWVICPICPWYFLSYLFRQDYQLKMSDGIDYDHAEYKHRFRKVTSSV